MWRKRACSFFKAEDAADSSVDNSSSPDGKSTNNESTESGDSEAKNNRQPAFPFTVANLVFETLTALRPKLKLCESLVEAEAAAANVEKEMISAIKEKAPDLALYLEKEDEPEQR